MSPNAGSCAQRFKRPKLKMSEFGVRKSLLIKKAPAENMRDLAMPQIHLVRWTRSRVFKGTGGQVCGVLVGQV